MKVGRGKCVFNKTWLEKILDRLDLFIYRCKEKVKCLYRGNHEYGSTCFFWIEGDEASNVINYFGEGDESNITFKTNSSKDTACIISRCACGKYKKGDKL